MKRESGMTAGVYEERAKAGEQQMFLKKWRAAADACERWQFRGHARIRDHPPTTLLWLLWEIVFRPLFRWRKALNNISVFVFFGVFFAFAFSTEQMILSSKHSVMTYTFHTYFKRESRINSHLWFHQYRSTAGTQVMLWRPNFGISSPRTCITLHFT